MRSWFSGVGTRSAKTRIRKSWRRHHLEQLEDRTLFAGLVHQGDMIYQGAFNVPTGQIGSSSFEYGGTALAYNPQNNSLFAVGHDWDQAVAEISIPELGQGAVEGLPTAEVLQPFTPVFDRVPNFSLTDDVKIGGLMVYGDKLVGSAYEFYDGMGDAVDSHFTLSSHDLASANVNGLYQVGDLGGGYVGGYMAQVPAEWQAALGTSYLTGQAGLSIISRTSAGPAAFGFDPAQLGSGVAAATPLVNYPIDHSITDIESTNPLFNTTSQIRGVVFPEGTDSVLFIGSHGTGDYWYGEYDEGGYDPVRQDKGPHAPEYQYQVWAYDAHDLAAVKNGEMQPWEIKPYDVWELNLPYDGGPTYIGGIAYDSASGQLYVSQQYGHGAEPVIHAFKVGEPSQSSGGAVPNQAPTDVTLSANSVVENALSGVAVGSLQSTDANVGDTFTYSLASGTGADDNASFTIVGNQLLTIRTFDFETKSQYSIRVRTTDSSGLSFEKSLTINVTDVNEAPTDVALTNATVAENLSAGTVVGGLKSTAPNASGTFTYSLVSGSGSGDNGAFKIVGDQLLTTRTFDFETKNQYSIRVRTTDASGLSFEKSLTIHVTDVNEGPTDVALTNSTVAENLPAGAVVGGLKTTAPSASGTFTYSLVSGSGSDDNAAFKIVGDQLQTAKWFNYELKNQYSVRVRTTDAFGLSFEKSFTINIADKNDGPELALSGSVGYKLNQAPIVLAPLATVHDVDSPNFDGGKLVVCITQGADASNRLVLSGGFKFVGMDLITPTGLKIGTLANTGIGTRALAVTFNANATPKIVQDLIRSISFRTLGGTNTATRTISFSLSDGDGGFSSVRTKTVNVQP